MSMTVSLLEEVVGLKGDGALRCSSGGLTDINQFSSSAERSLPLHHCIIRAAASFAFPLPHSSSRTPSLPHSLLPLPFLPRPLLPLLFPFFLTLSFLSFPRCPAGSVNVDFEVEAKGSDSASLAALENSTNDLQSNLASGGLNISIGGTSFDAPVQNVSIATVDVTPAVKATYAFELRVI